MKCFHCQSEFEGRADAKFCSPKCRVKAGRSQQGTGHGAKEVIESKPSYITLTPEQVQEADKRFGMTGSVISAYKSYIKFKQDNSGDTWMPNWMREYLTSTERYA